MSQEPKTVTPEGEVKMGSVFKEFEELCISRGRAFYFAEGFAEGLAEARAERSKQIEQIITNMLRDGLPHETIARYCGTSDATITAIEQRLRAAGGPS